MDEFPRPGDGHSGAETRHAEATLPELKDTCVIAGLFGDPSDVEGVLERLRAAETRRLEAEVISYESDTRRSDEKLLSLNTQRAETTDSLAEAHRQRTALEEPLRTTQQREGHLAADKAAISTELIAKRTTYVTRAVSEKARAYSQVRGEIALQLVTDQTQLLEQQRQLFEIEAERRRVNEPEFQRRVDFLKQQQDAVRAKLDSHEQRIECLRTLGITRTTSGFLLWSGYLAFGGVGWLLGESLRVSGGPGGLLETFFAALGKGTTALVARIGVVQTLALAVLLPLVLLGATFGLLVLWDWGLRQFDRTWLERPRRKADRDGPVRLWVGSAGSTIRREHYVDVLARLPLLYLWSLIPVLLAVVTGLAGAASQPANAQDPWQSLLYTYVGIVLVISATGLTMLYITQIIEPRRPSLQGSPGVRRILALNFELLTVSGGAAVVLVAYPFLRIWWPSAPPLWAPAQSLGAAVLLIVVSFATAYGLVFHGLFKDLDSLQVELRRYDAELQKYVSLPSIEAVDAQSIRFRESLESLYDDIDRLWATPDWWQLLVGDVPFRRSRRFWRTPKRTDPLDLSALDHFTLGDVLFEPSALSRLFQANAGIEQTRHELTRLNELARDLNQRLDQLRTELNRIDSQVEQIQDTKASRRRLYHEQLDRIGLLYTDLLTAARTAFKLGASLHSGASPVTGGG